MKRGSENGHLSKEDYNAAQEDDEGGGDGTGTFQKADSSTLKGRRIVRARRSAETSAPPAATSQPKVNVFSNFSLTNGGGGGGLLNGGGGLGNGSVAKSGGDGQGDAGAGGAVKTGATSNPFASALGGSGFGGGGRSSSGGNASSGQPLSGFSFAQPFTGSASTFSAPAPTANGGSSAKPLGGTSLFGSTGTPSFGTVSSTPKGTAPGQSFTFNIPSAPVPAFTTSSLLKPASTSSAEAAAAATTAASAASSAPSTSSTLPTAAATTQPATTSWTTSFRTNTNNSGAAFPSVSPPPARCTASPPTSTTTALPPVGIGASAHKPPPSPSSSRPAPPTATPTPISGPPTTGSFGSFTIASGGGKPTLSFGSSDNRGRPPVTFHTTAATPSPQPPPDTRPASSSSGTASTLPMFPQRAMNGGIGLTGASGPSQPQSKPAHVSSTIISSARAPSGYGFPGAAARQTQGYGGGGGDSGGVGGGGGGGGRGGGYGGGGGGGGSGRGNGRPAKRPAPSQEQERQQKRPASEPNPAKYAEKMTKLNNGFRQWVKEQLDRNPYSAWVEGVKDYHKYAKSLKERYGPNETSGFTGADTGGPSSAPPPPSAPGGGPQGPSRSAAHQQQRPFPTAPSQPAGHQSQPFTNLPAFHSSAPPAGGASNARPSPFSLTPSSSLFSATAPSTSSSSDRVDASSAAARTTAGGAAAVTGGFPFSAAPPTASSATTRLPFGTGGMFGTASAPAPAPATARPSTGFPSLGSDANTPLGTATAFGSKPPASFATAAPCTGFGPMAPTPAPAAAAAAQGGGGGDDEGEVDDEFKHKAPERALEGEKDPNEVYKFEPIKVFVFDAENKQWKDSGKGNVRLYKDRNEPKKRWLVIRNLLGRVQLTAGLAPQMRFTKKPKPPSVTFACKPLNEHNQPLGGNASSLTTVMIRVSSHLDEFVAKLEELTAP